MAFPRQFLDELMSRSDILDVVSSYVHLQRKGGNYFGLCPFHNEKTPSFSVSPDKQIFYCFGCKKGGSAVGFIMEAENLSYPDAVRFLAKRAGLTVPEEENADPKRAALRERLLSLNKEAARWFYDNLSKPEGGAVTAYLQRRRITPQTATRFGLGASLERWDALMSEMLSRGYTKEELLQAGLIVQNDKGRLYDKFRNRLIFPVIDLRGDVVAFGGRVLDGGEPKYLNSPETIVYSKRRNLYGINLAKRTKRPNIILCEGNIDVITLHQAGFDNAVASMGTALTVEQTRLLSRYTKELVLCYDNDGAGRAATEKAIALLSGSEFNVRVLSLPNKLVDGQPAKQDVDDFIKAQGSAAFQAILDGSAGELDYRMAELAGKYDLNGSEGKTAYAKEVCALLSTVPNAVERDVYAGRAAEKIGVSKEALLLDLKQERRKRQKRALTELKKENLNVAALRQPAAPGAGRDLRYDNLRSAMAEEGLVRLLFLDGSLAERCGSVGEEDFSVPFLGRIYAAQRGAHREGGALLPAQLQGELTAAEMGRLTALLQKPEDMKKAGKALSDYIRIIREEAAKRPRTEDQAEDQTHTGTQTGPDARRNTDPLAAAQEKYKSKKAYGGKKS